MDKKHLTYDQAVSLLPEEEYIHTFVSGGILIGADWSREDILNKLRKSSAIELTGGVARSMGHGMCAYDEKNSKISNALFIETDSDRLAEIDPEGEIDEKTAD